MPGPCPARTRLGGAALLCCSLLLPAAALAREGAQEGTQEGSGRGIFPSGRDYPAYRADPRSPELALTVLHVERLGVPEAGSPRYGLKLGGRFGLLRWGGGGEDAWQLDIEAGFLGQFDIDHSLDNLGWDGLYALLVSRGLGRGVVVQAGAKHVSSHLGDEYAERTGRRRIDATREELTAGIVGPVLRWQAYAEAGWDPEPEESASQEAGRLQAGVQREWRLEGRRLGWFGAANLEALEERDWEVDLSLQAGVVLPAGERRWRAGLQWYDGRVPLAELSAHDESYLVLGLWLEP